MKKRKLPLILLLMLLCLFSTANVQAAVKTVRLNKTYTDSFAKGETYKSYTLKVDKSVNYVDIYVDANFLEPPYVNRVCHVYGDVSSSKKGFKYAYPYDLYRTGFYSFTGGATSEIYFTKDMMRKGVKSFCFRVQKHRHRWYTWGDEDQCIKKCRVCDKEKAYRKHIYDKGTPCSTISDGVTFYGKKYKCKRCGYVMYKYDPVYY